MIPFHLYLMETHGLNWPTYADRELGLGFFSILSLIVTTNLALKNLTTCIIPNYISQSIDCFEFNCQVKMPESE